MKVKASWFDWIWSVIIIWTRWISFAMSVQRDLQRKSISSYTKQEFITNDPFLVMCHVKVLTILISQTLRKTLLWSRIWNWSISCAAFNRPAVITAVLIALGTKWTSVEDRQTKRELGWRGKWELVKVYLIAMRLCPVRIKEISRIHAFAHSKQSR